MKRKKYFLRMLALLALMLPWSLQAQNAKVSEYDGSSSTAAYSSIVGTTGASAKTLGNGGYVDVEMPFAMYFGETQVPQGSTLRIWNDGSVTFDGIAALADARIAPLYYASGYTATTVYTKSASNMLTVEWRKVTSGTNSYSFQLKLYASGDIDFCYGPMTINSSINVFVGMMSSSTDIYRVGGRDNGSQWDSIYRNTTGTSTRTLSSTYAPAYDVNGSTGMVYAFTQPACVKPTAAYAEATAWNTIDVEWVVSSAGSSYEVKYSTDPDFNPTNQGSSKTVNNGAATSTTITGLTGSTTYYIYVRKVCNGTPSGWSPMTYATTLQGCFSANLPSVTPDGVVTWTSPNELVTSYDVKYGSAGFDPETEGTLIGNITGLTTTIPNLGSNTRYDVYLRTKCSASNVTTDWVGPVTFISPCVGGCTYTLVLEDTYGDSWNGNTLDYYVGGELFGSYANNDESAYNEGRAPDNDTILLSICAGDQIAFVYNASGMYANENNVTVYNHLGEAIIEGYNGSNGTATLFTGVGCQGITCPKPSGLAITEYSGNSVTLSWTENGTATAWQIAYGHFATDEDYTIVDVTTNPYTVGNLGLGDWYFFVRSNCAANDQSDWVGSVSQTFGYCTPSPTSVDNNGIVGVTFGNDIVVNDNNTTTASTRYQNHIDMVGDIYAGVPTEISITYDAGYTYGTNIWVDLNGDFVFSDDEQLYHGLSTNDRPTTLVATVTIPANTPLGDYVMRIGGTDNDNGPTPCYTGTYGALRDYTVRVIAAPSCFTPSGLAASNVTTTSATLTWDEVGLSTQWEVKYGPTGFDIFEDGVSMMVSTTPTLALDYLEMGTSYDVYVRAICNPEGPTPWSNSITFTTANIACLQYGELGAEENVTIGEGTTDLTYIPAYSLYDYSYTQQIYTADEIGGSGVINSIAFEISAVKPRLVDIYLVETDKSSFASNTDWVAVTDADKVFTGTIGNATGWETYTLTTPFNYSGNGNLVVVVDNNNGAWSGGLKAKGGSGYTNMALYKYQDNNNIDPANPPSGSRYSSRNNLKLGIQHAQCVLTPCYPPQLDITLAETEYAATLTFTSSDPEITGQTYGMIWGPQGFNPTTSGTAVTSINNNGTYTISNLAAQTTYDVYVYAVCGGSNGDTVRYGFTTPFIPTCKSPIIDGEYGASNIAYNSATLTWRQPGDAPQFWTVRYATSDFNPATAAATDYTEMTVTSAQANLTGLVAGTTYYVYLKATCSTSPVDESPWSSMSNASPAYTFTTPACSTPTDVAASDVTNSSAVIKWTEAGASTAWTVKYGPAGFDPDNEGIAVAVTADSVELTGLDAYTTFDVYVKANCTATDESDWSSVCTFLTVCPDGGDVEVVGVTAGRSYYIPVNTYYNYSYTQQIITAEEIPSAGAIQGISLSYYHTAALDPTKYDVTIYIGTTDKASFASSSDFVDPATLTAVWHGTFNVEQGWNNFIFDTPFEYDGSSNIVIAFDDDVTGYNSTSHMFNTMTTESPMTLSYHSDSYNPDATSAATLSAFSGTKSTYSYRNVMKLMANCNTDVTCYAPASVSTEVSPNNVVSVTWAARTDLRPVVNNFEMKYGLAGFNPDNQGSGVLVSNLNNVFNYNITAALEAEVDYDVYVRTVCGDGDYSKWTKTTFTTYPTCWAPDSLTVTGTTTNSAILKWVNQANAPIQANRWEVVYGEEGFDPDRATPIVTTNNTAFEVTGLRHTAKYEFYVRSICSATDYSPWSAVAKGSTQCGIWNLEDMPFVENFDGVTGNTSGTEDNHVLPTACWNYYNGGTNTSYKGLPSIYSSTSYAHSTPNSLRFYNATQSTYGDQIAILPQFNFDLDTIEVSFYARFNNVNAVLQVGVMSDPTDPSTFEVVEAVQASTTNTQLPFNVSFRDYTGNARYVALKVEHSSSVAQYVYLDDLVVKLRERINVLADNGGTINACNELVMPDTSNGGSYHNGLNATYVIRPAEAGKVAHITGTYDLEYGYDFLTVYRGGVNPSNLVARYTGAGNIDYKTTSNLWADSGYVSLVFTTDNDNAFQATGFKLLVECEDPEAAADIDEEIEANGTYTWRNGETYTNNVVRTGLTYDANEQPTPDIDRAYTATYTYVNVAGADSVTYNMNLTVHPTYSLTYNATICERESFAFYGNEYTTTGTYTVAMQSQFGADSTGILNLQINPAPSAAIYRGGVEVTEINGHCDNFDLTLLARSDNSAATFVWEDQSTAATRVVNPHESNTYTVIATAPTGCTSLPATVTVNTTPVPALTINGDAEICYGQSATLTLTDANEVPATYRWSNGSTATSITVNPTTTTTYTVTATTSNASACVATAEFTVLVNQLPVVDATASVNQICRDSAVTLTATEVEGYTYSWNTGATTPVATAVATASGVYTVTVTDEKGCVNQFNTANVTVYPSYEVQAEMSVCFTHNPYTWEQMEITSNGVYDQMLKTRAPGRPLQCDSLVHLTFSFEQMGVENSAIEVCQGNTYKFEDITRIATADTNLTYIDNSGDCPVQYNLAVKVNPVKATTVPYTVCDSYTWPVSNENYDVSGQYPVTLSTTMGCDSVVTLDLTVNYQNTGVETVTACDNYVWDLNGVRYNVSTNKPTFTLQNQWGCDSVVTLDLTVNYRSYHEDFHCVRDARSYTWIDGQTYRLGVDVNDSIQWITGTNNVQCNEIALLHLVMNPVLDSLAWTDVEVCDEYVNNNHVVFTDNNDCEGHTEPLYLRETGDYQFRTRAEDGHDQWTCIHLTVAPSTYHTTVATECLPYTWTIEGQNGEPFEVATITAEMVNGAAIYNTSVDLAEAGYVATGCSSIEVLRLTPKYPTTETIEAEICQSGTWTAPEPYTYSVNASELNVGVNTLTYNLGSEDVNAAGCPVNKNVELTVNPVYSVVYEATLCESDFTYNTETEAYEYELTGIATEETGTVLTALLTIPGDLNEEVFDGVYTADWQTTSGCTSSLTVNYTVLPTIREDLYEVACYEYTWDLTGETYRYADGATQEPVYETTTLEGCKSITTLHLTINERSHGYVTIPVCTSYEYDGVVYHSDKTFDVPYEGEEPIVLGCDSVTHITYHIQQTELIHQYVVSNRPYTWQNGQTYSQSVENVYYDEPMEGDCGNVYTLHFTLVDPIAFCDDAFPYNTGINGIVIEEAGDNVWNNNDPQGNDTILYYTVYSTYNSNSNVDACDNYVWEGTTYNESGSYNVSYTSVNGCDSTLNLNLTIKNSNTGSAEETACDSYTWTEGNNATYTTSGTYTYTTTNEAGCDSVVTLTLTINTNPGVEVTVNNGCDSYTWDVNNETYTQSGNYSYSFNDANGCQGDSVLHLTINQSYETNSEIIVNEAASYTYLGVMYTAPFDSTIDHTFQSVNGCDSIDHLHIVIPIVSDDEITEINVEACGEYTWTIAGVEHTYIWIPMSERMSHGMALYKDATFNKYVYTYPTDTTFNEDHVMVHVDVLYLNLLESTTSTETINIPVSLGTYTFNGVDQYGEEADVTINFTYADRGTTMVTEPVGIGSVEYCNDYRTYTVNLIDNYDTAEYFVCADATTYEWGEQTYTVGEPGHTYWFVQTENAGTMDELVHVRKVNQRAVNAQTINEVACDTYTWTAGNGETYTESVSNVVYDYTDANGCAATKTLNLTVNYNTNTEVTKDECDSYKWIAADGGNGNTYTTSGDYTYNYNTPAPANCPSVNTLHLTIRNNTNQTINQTACVSYTWSEENGGDGRVLTTSGTETYSYNALNGCPSVNTLNLTINQPTSAGTTMEVCDGTEWNGTEYTTSGTYYHSYNTTAGCASVDTLYLTVNHGTFGSETLAACDSMIWNDVTYYTSSPAEGYIFTYTNGAGCPSADTLHLTINVNNSGVDTTVVACLEYEWRVNPNRPYNTSGDWTVRTQDDNGCWTTNTLHLTINANSSYDSILYVSDGSYRYNGELWGEGVYNRTEHYTNAAGCDSTLNITFNIGTAVLGIDNVVMCNDYTWRNGETYVWISNEERNSNLNDNQDAPLYKTINGEYIYYNPTYTVPQEGYFDSIYMLALTLNQSAIGYDELTVNVSDREVNYGGETFHFDELADQQQDFVSTDMEYDVHFQAIQHCDSIITVTVHIVNNYEFVEEDDICVTTTSYTWRDHTVSTATNDYDNAHTYYLYDTLPTGTIEYMVVNQHPFVYATERRTACDEYTWNGTTYTESTSNATAYFAAGTVINEGADNEYSLICDSTVTLILTINHNTNAETITQACDTYTWLEANGGNGETYTESGVYSFDYYAAAPGNCPSTNTLYLTINHPTDAEYTVDQCDSYVWSAEEGGDGRELTASGVYTYDYLSVGGNCPSTNTLNLTIRNNSNRTFTVTKCDSYVWNAEEGGDGETYNQSDVYYYEYTAANGCPSVNTLNLTVNYNSSHTETITACDTYTWHGVNFNASTIEYYDYNDNHNCPSVDTLVLTVNYSTHNSETVAACQTYTWHGETYTNNSNTGSVAHETHLYTYTNDAQCPSVDTLHLTLGSGRTFGTETVTYCGPYTWIVNGEEVGVLDESMETSASFLNPRTGCDSLVFLNLTINPQNVTEATICDDGEYIWSVDNNSYTEAGTYDVSETDDNGNCISNERLVLTVNPTQVTNISGQICLGNGYYDNGFSIEPGELSVAGEYTFTDTRWTELGCKNTVILTLTVGEILSNPVEATACDSYTWTAGDGNDYTYTASGVYNSGAYANLEGCTTVDVLTLTINANASTGYTVTECDSYIWNGEEYTESGDYTFDYTDGNGCASTDTLHLTINSSVIITDQVTACDSYEWTAGTGEVYTTTGIYEHHYSTTDNCNGTRYLALTVNYNTSTEYEVTTCDSYTWNDVEYTESGDYEYQYEAENGCPSKDVLHLTLKKSTFSEETAENCNFYNWHGETYYESGDYTYTSTNNIGCQHTAMLHLTINNSVTVTIDTAVCGYLSWNGIRYEETDIITHTFNAANGCDSTEVVNLTVNSTAVAVVNAVACDSYTWDLNGITYTNSGLDMYLIEGAAANGCDSLVTLQVVINHNSSSETTVTACDNYLWNDVNYTTSGDYSYDYFSTSGCPSTDVLHLTVNSSTTSEETAEACNYYIWNGAAYNQSGDYTYVSTNAAGCQNTATLHLTINTQVTSEFNATTCGSYTWDGASYNTTGDYTRTFSTAAGCDSVVTMHLTINPAVQTSFQHAACNSYTWNDVAYNESGIYQHTYEAYNGCDSVVTLYLTITPTFNMTVAVTACDSYNWNGTEYNQSGIHTSHYTAINGCDSTVTLNLTINNSYQNTVNETACGSYTWNGATYYQSGIYTNSNLTVNGCDSITVLNLTVLPNVSSSIPVTSCGTYTWNGQAYSQSGVYTSTFDAYNGCDSTVTLILTVNQPVSANVEATVCDTYTWNGQTFTQSTVYPQTFTAANGCDSTVTLYLTVNQSATTTLNETACNSFAWNGASYTESGSYVQNFSTVNGCDSTVTLNLTITPAINNTIMMTVCGSYTWDDVTYTQSGIYTNTYEAYNGCDSTVTLSLTIAPAIQTMVNVTTCDSYVWNGVTYTESGNYPMTFSSLSGCDSVVTLNLTVNNSIDTLIAVMACDNYMWNGATYTVDGIHEYSYTAANGCDSTVTLALTLNYSVVDAFSASACGSYTWNGTTYDASGAYTQTLTALNGCDSIVTLSLSIYGNTFDTVNATACNSYEWINGETYTESVSTSYTVANVHGCDSIITLNLTVNYSTTGIDVVSECDGFIWIDGNNYTASTNEPTYTLQSSNGCDSVVTLHLTINHSVEIHDAISISENQLPYTYHGNVIDGAGEYVFTGYTSNGCDSTVILTVTVTQVGIEVVSFDDVKVYPNPTRGRVTVTADEVVKVEVLDIVGRCVATFEDTNTFDLSNLGEGAYTLRITLPNGTTVRKIVKK